MKPSSLTSLLICITIPLSIYGQNKKVLVHESRGSLSVASSAPIPEEVTNDAQAKALSREAAIALGQSELLAYVLQMKTRSKKTLAEAEIPSLETQNKIRGHIKGARVKDTKWEKGFCTVTLTLDKKLIKEIQRKN